MIKRWGHHLIFFLISFTLVFIWFSSGNTLAAGETGNPFHNLFSMYSISGWAWGNQVLGGSSGLTVASALFFGVLSFLQNIGVAGFVLQAMFFFVCLYMGMLGMYLLAKEVFPKLSTAAFLSASLFYIVNPFALMNIWNRFLLNTILFYAFLPVAIWFLLLGLRKKNYSYSIALSLLTVILSYGFAAPAQTIIFWGLFLFTIVYYTVFFERKVFALKFFFLTFLSWGLFNFWWIYQQIAYRFSATFTTSTSQLFPPL